MVWWSRTGLGFFSSQFVPVIDNRRFSVESLPSISFTMGAVKLELRCPKSVGGVMIDPQPDWSFDTLLSELSSIEEKLNISPSFPLPFTKTKSREVSSAKSVERRAFVMRIDEMEDVEEDCEVEAHGQLIVAGKRFSCDEFYISDSDDSEVESSSGVPYSLMDKVGLVEGALFELAHEHQLSLTEEVRSQRLALETDLINENKKYNDALDRVKRDTETQQEIERRQDLQHQREIQEALDNHLTAVQRDHEHRSQLEERRIRDDAAIEEAKRREKALLEEKLRQEKARLLAEKKRAEEAKAAAVEADRKAAKEAAEKVAKEDADRAAATAVVASGVAIGRQTGASSVTLNDESSEFSSDRVKEVIQAGNILKCAESAMKLEERRQQIYKEVAIKNEELVRSDPRIHGSNIEKLSEIRRLIKQTTGSKDNVRTKADRLIEIFFDSSCPQSISVATFAEKIVDQCLTLNKSVFAYALVAVLVSSQVPLAMDLLVAQLNRACIYTVPKHFTYSKSLFGTKEAYRKAIGYKEEDGKLESEENFVRRVDSCMKLYGALVQTEDGGVQNKLGLKEGWAWLARFLNALPANLYTAVALLAFLEMAGYALYRKYQSHFMKLLKIIYRDFLSALKQREGDAKLAIVITSIQTYIESEKFLEEPEGRSLPSSLLSRECAPDEYAQPPSSYHRQSNQDMAFRHSVLNVKCKFDLPYDFAILW
ncbi:hypothetical protein Vadar_015617 [Vaccinium darrowii]|uniref:Uncharacterized protein n=1 Tax=Vaccinium darrowii TaxID=229202 RepID=A0ACB7YWQ2_9ERIC|nr:hypothetical protein Vadar_015617 [Vaccinium darrowii]